MLKKNLAALLLILSCCGAWSAQAKSPLTVVYNRGVAPIKFTTEAGEPSGLLNEYWQLLGRKAGLNFRFVEVDSFRESLEMVKNGAADLHAGLFYTDERSRYLGYSKPVLDLNYYIYSSSDLPAFASLGETRGYLLGVVQGGYTENFIKKKVPHSRLVVYEDVDSLLEAVLNGDVKVFVASDIHLNYYLAARGLENPFQHTADSLYQQTYYGAVAKQNRALLKRLIAAQQQITVAEKQQLRDRWLSAKVHDVVRPQIATLSDEELAWIKEHPVIRVANELDYPPFDFNQEGQPKGLSIDLLNLLAARTGLRLEYRSGYSWKQLLEMMRKKQLDVIHSLNSSAKRAEFLLFTDPYVSNQTVIVTATSNDEIHDVADLERKAIAVVDGYNTKRVLQEHLQNARYVKVGSPLDALKAVSSGQADATVRYDGVASYLIHNHLLNNLKFVNEFKVEGDSLHELFIGVRKDWPILRNILQKGLDAVSVEEMAALKRKWISLDSAASASRVQLSSAERHWLAEHPQITLGSDYRWPPFDFVDKHGKHAGLSADYVKLIEQRTGLKINVRSGVWAEILAQMKRGELDGLACAVKTEERTAYLDFSKPYLAVPTVIIVPQDNQRIKELSDLYGKTVSINKGSYMHDWLAKRYPQIKLHLSTSNEASLEAVSYGEADAYIGNLAVANYIIRERLLTNLKVVKKLDGMVTKTSIAVDKQQPLLLDIIQKALDSITDQERQAILDKWYLAATEEKVVLTEQERTWLEQHPVVRFTGAANWAPVSYRTENGEYAGIAGEYLGLLAKKSGLKIEAVPAESWSDTLLLARQGKIDLVNAISIDQKRAALFDFTDAYLQADAVLVTRDSVNFVNDLERLEGQRVGTVENFIVAQHMAEDYPTLHLQLYPNAAEGLQALSQGRVDAFVIDIPTFEYYSKRLSLVNLKISGLTPYTYNIGIGVTKGLPELVSILNKSLALLTQKEKNRIYNNWVTLETPLIDYSLIWKTALAAAVFLLAMFYWNRRLAREVSLRKQAEARALQASRAKSDFLANMSHEIRTPMNSVLGFAELLDNMITDPEQKSYLKSIRSGGRALLEIINDILDLSKIEAGKMVVKPEPLSLSNLFVEMENFFRARMAQKNLQFNCRIEADFPAYIKMDAVRLRQILINLIGNAIKFTERGSIELLCSAVQLHPEEETVDFSLEVIDSGIGIPPEQQQGIFNKFEQQFGLDSAKYGGTGLGLAICQNLTRLLGGSIELESCPGEGSTFRVKFTAVELTQEQKAAESSEAISMTQFDPANVLIADDVKDNRQLVIGHFKGSAISFYEASNGKEALELLSKLPFDLVLLDLRMPVLNGYETITQIKANESMQRVPVIAFTASVMGEDLEKVSQYGFNAYLRKPVSRQELLRVAAAFLPFSSRGEEQGADLLDAVAVPPAQLSAFLAAIDTGLAADWQEVKDKGDFELISRFATNLRLVAEEHAVEHVVDYAQRLQEHVTSFDIIEVDAMMKQFPEIIAALRKLVSGGGSQNDA